MNDLQDLLLKIQSNFVISEQNTYQCDVCKDKGALFTTDDEGRMFAKKCTCQIKKENQERIENSGLKELFLKCTFDNYITKSDFQGVVKSKALEFLEQDRYSFFYIGGQVGSGKTHICTAICSELIKTKSVKYVSYLDMITELKQTMYQDQEKFNQFINRLKNVSVLYIDDLFKTNASNADVFNIMSLINYRYQANKTTIISSEKNIAEINAIDEAIGSRIVEKAGKFLINISASKEKNYRLLNFI